MLIRVCVLIVCGSRKQLWQLECNFGFQEACQQSGSWQAAVHYCIHAACLQRLTMSRTFKAILWIFVARASTCSTACVLEEGSGSDRSS